MILHDVMADLKPPPNGTEMPRLKKRKVMYDERSKDMIVNGQITAKHQHELSNEAAKVLHEKWQQTKAKSTKKRQRDPNAPPGQVTKRKLATNGKSDGPASKQANLDRQANIGDNPDATNDNEELDDFLVGLDLPDNFDNNIDDFISTMLGDENSNGSQPGKEESVTKNTKSQQPKQHGPSQKHPQHINYAQQQQQQQQHSQQANQPPHVSSASSPRLHHAQHLHPQQQTAVPGYSGPRSLPGHGYIKEEQPSMHPGTAPFSRSMSETAALSLHHIAAPQRLPSTSMPVEYPPVQHNGYPSAHPVSAGPYAQNKPPSLPHGHPQEFGRQMSAPVTAAQGTFYHQQGHMTRAAPTNPYHPQTSTPGGNFHPSQYSSVQLQQHQSMQDMQRIDQMRAIQQGHPSHLSRANSQPVPGAHPYMEQRVAPSNAAAAAPYYNTADPGAQQRHAQLNQMHPHLHQQPAPGQQGGHPQYMQGRPHYQHQTSQHAIHQSQLLQQQQKLQQQAQQLHSSHPSLVPSQPNPHQPIPQDGRHPMHSRVPMTVGHSSSLTQPPKPAVYSMPHSVVPGRLPIQGSSPPPGSMISHPHQQQVPQQPCHMSSNNNSNHQAAALQQQQQQIHRPTSAGMHSISAGNTHVSMPTQNGIHPSQNPHHQHHQQQHQMYEQQQQPQHSVTTTHAGQHPSKTEQQQRGQLFVGSSADDLSDLEAILSGGT